MSLKDDPQKELDWLYKQWLNVEFVKVVMLGIIIVLLAFIFCNSVNAESATITFTDAEEVAE